ncbi:MAG TPA: response regulator transcription factor [Polyangiales bacterium]|nr:response regulator transcription factor [Polyangiales bacterium]
MAPHVLIVEDDAELGAQLVKRLSEAGYATTWWREGRRLAREEMPAADLVLLDLMLPGTYGMDMLKSLRSFSDVPVLVLSARTDSSDKVRALQLGADDYLTKPFWPAELVERVRARLRRPVMQRADSLSIGALLIDLAGHHVRFHDQPIELTRVEFEVLLALARRAGSAVTRKWLVEHALDGERGGNERTLDAHVSRIRKKLGDDAPIETVWGIGYRLVEPG